MCDVSWVGVTYFSSILSLQKEFFFDKMHSKMDAASSIILNSWKLF